MQLEEPAAPYEPVSARSGPLEPEVREQGAVLNHFRLAAHYRMTDPRKGGRHQRREQKLLLVMKMNRWRPRDFQCSQHLMVKRPPLLPNPS